MKKELVNSTFKTLIFDLNGTITGRVSEHPDHIAFRDHYIMEKLGKSLSGKLPNTTSLALQIWRMCNRYLMPSYTKFMYHAKR